jgi:hypothetical protein
MRLSVAGPALDTIGAVPLIRYGGAMRFFPRWAAKAAYRAPEPHGTPMAALT